MKSTYIYALPSKAHLFSQYQYLYPYEIVTNVTKWDRYLSITVKTCKTYDDPSTLIDFYTNDGYSSDSYNYNSIYSTLLVLQYAQNGLPGKSIASLKLKERKVSVSKTTHYRLQCVSLRIFS